MHCNFQIPENKRCLLASVVWKYVLLNIRLLNNKQLFRIDPSDTVAKSATFGQNILESFGEH